MRLFLDKPPTSLRVVGRSTEGDDGTDNVVLDVICGVEPIGVKVDGVFGDAWRYPDNRTNWIIRAIRLDDSHIRLFFKESTPANSYRVTINGNDAGTYAPVKPNFAEGPAIGQKPEEKPATEFSELDIIGLQAELVELRASMQNEQSKNSKLAMANADLRTEIESLKMDKAKFNMECDSLRQAVANEQAKSASLQAELDRTAGLRLGLEMVAKEMGWGR